MNIQVVSFGGTATCKDRYDVFHFSEKQHYAESAKYSPTNLLWWKYAPLCIAWAIAKKLLVIFCSKRYRLMDNSLTKVNGKYQTWDYLISNKLDIQNKRNTI